MSKKHPISLLQAFIPVIVLVVLLAFNVLYVYGDDTDFKLKRQEYIDEIMLKYSAHLEQICLAYPYQWYNFFDFWKK